MHIWTSDAHINVYVVFFRGQNIDYAAQIASKARLGEDFSRILPKA